MSPGRRRLAKRRHGRKPPLHAPARGGHLSASSCDESESDGGGIPMDWAATNTPPKPFGARLLARRAPHVLVELTPDLMLYVLGYLEPRAAHAAAAAPICRALRERVTDNREVWAHLCTCEPWRVERAQLEGRPVQELRRTHREVVAASRRAAGAPVDVVAGIMAAHARVAGVQMTCLASLAERLHCETARKRALDAGVTAAVVRALWRYPTDAELQVAALHCVVFLARPIGGAEGMVYHRGMASQGLDAFLGKRGGIAAVLASMRDHAPSGKVQAMGCWSLVNLALNHQQKLELLARNGLDRVLGAMAAHPAVLEVQFRALFALINLVIPEAGGAGSGGGADAHARVVGAVLRAMGRFPESEKLVRCGCLVLHNLSLDDRNIPHLLAAGVARPLQRAARCHEDADVQRSAVATLRRLRVTPEAAFLPAAPAPAAPDDADAPSAEGLR